MAKGWKEYVYEYNDGKVKVSRCTSLGFYCGYAILPWSRGRYGPDPYVDTGFHDFLDDRGFSSEITWSSYCSRNKNMEIGFDCGHSWNPPCCESRDGVLREAIKLYELADEFYNRVAGK